MSSALYNNEKVLNFSRLMNDTMYLLIKTLKWMKNILYYN